jgi:hypothetical protein
MSRFFTFIREGSRPYIANLYAWSWRLTEPWRVRKSRPPITQYVTSLEVDYETVCKERDKLLKELKKKAS